MQATCNSSRPHPKRIVMTNFQLLPNIEIMPRFIELCPELQKSWDAHLKYWSEDERGDYIDISVLAHFIVDRFNEGRTESFDKIFELIEEILNKGNAKEKEILSLGLLEDIQNISSHTAHGYRPFEKWLGPTTRKIWIEIEKAWEGKRSLMEVVREEIKRKKTE